MKIALLKNYKINLSEKVVRKLMNEEHLIVFQPKSKRKYSSYYGEITPEVPNIIKRNFSADKPYEKTLTDITEFAIPDGKVYLSPIIDCYDGLPISWTIGKSSNSELTKSILLEAQKILKDNKTIIHSDREFHYRIPSRIDNMNKFGYIRSMSKKGCSPDNSMCEGFFGTIKNEFFYPNN